MEQAMAVEYRLDKDIPPGKLIAFFRASDYNHWWTERNVRACLNHCYVFVTAWVGDQVVGTLAVNSDEVNFAFFDELVVHPSFRGKGIGSTLLRKALERIAPLGLDFVQLIPIPGRESFFARAGFKVIPDHQVMEL